MTEKQKEAAILLAGGSSVKEVARKLKIGSASCYRWMRDPDFKAYFEGLEIDPVREQILKALEEKAVSGDVASAKAYWEMKGFARQTVRVIIDYGSEDT